MSKIGLTISISRKNTKLNEEQIDFGIKLGRQATRARGNIFVKLTRQQREAFAFFEKVQGPDRRGEARLFLNHTKGEIFWDRFYPLGGPIALKTRKLAGLGIGSVVYHSIIEWLASHPELDNYKIHHKSGEMSEAAIRQFNKTGINPNLKPTLIEYREIIRRAVEQRFGKGKRVFV